MRYHQIKSADARRQQLEPIIIERFLARGETMEHAKAYLAQCTFDLAEVLQRIVAARQSR
ncbi:MAG: hypothetical protein VYD90_19390 [Pseudomonadota bacterium]|nr:hypothetical protein [Pseudomonadota bacterium]